MKKIVTGLAALALATSLTACGDGDEKADPAAKCEAAISKFITDMQRAGMEYGPGEVEQEKADAAVKCEADPAGTLKELEAVKSGDWGAVEEPVDGDGEYIDETDVAPPLYDQQDVVDYLDLKKGGVVPGDGFEYGDWTYTTAAGVKCGISTIMTTANEIEWEAGPTTVSTPEGNVGVQVDSAKERTCVNALVPALAGFEPSMAGE